MPCLRKLGDPAQHNFFRIFKISLTFASIVMSILCIVIIRKTRSISSDYARLLFMLIIAAGIFDIYSHLVFDVQYIMPELCIYRLTPLINIPLNPGWGFIIWVTLIALNAPLYAACFIHRHQIIVPHGSWFKLNRYVHYASLVVITTPCLTYGCSYYIAWDDPDEGLLNQLSCEWAIVIIPLMQCIYRSPWIRNLWGAFLMFCSFIFVAVISLHTFLLIRQARNLSARTKTFHRTMLYSLIVVVVVPMSLIVAPFAAAFIYYLFLRDLYSLGFDGMEMATLIIAFHSVVHSLVLIMTTPIFRKRFIEMFQLKRRGSITIQPHSANFATHLFN